MYQRFFKRLLDVLLSGLALIVLSPIILILYLLVRQKLGQPAFFVQERPGKDHQIFKMYKFRTMTNATDANNNLLPDSQRLTPFGKMLRSTSLDELPELWNILIGDMSLVGPRPLLTSYLPLYNKFQAQRHLVRPGLTGLAQVKGRNALTWDEKFQLDVDYVHNISFVNDLKIILLTMVTVFKRDGISHAESATMEPFKGDGKQVEP
ncbi:sugar transferase [Fundicoccus culcitae]|uniref:Sugar transferase n=1 Tax=Fundicoccus culcitae TaxID=2969821 RepID=A0ABY5PAF9_9LACT|nr:sugar transferase [Fundicoccus culcitae]